jgi:hypothetical protein
VRDFYRLEALSLAAELFFTPPRAPPKNQTKTITPQLKRSGHFGWPLKRSFVLTDHICLAALREARQDCKRKRFAEC